MAEYIEREAFLANLERDFGRTGGAAILRHLIELAPTADVVPAVRGRWVFDAVTAKHGKPYRCSNCKEEHGDTHNFCPSCGARMDGE